MIGRQWLGVVVLAVIATGCASRTPPTRPPAAGRAPAHDGRTASGLASFYGDDFHGRTTASGVRFDMNAMVAAHPTYPFGTVVRVTNLRNGRAVRVRIVDRGPAAGPRAAGVIIDLSRRAAQALDFIGQGRTQVRLEVVRWGRGGLDPDAMLM